MQLYSYMYRKIYREEKDEYRYRDLRSSSYYVVYTNSLGKIILRFDSRRKRKQRKNYRYK